MIVLGVILFILGLILNVHWLWAVGIVLMVIGAVFWLLGRAGHTVGGRRYWY